MESKEKASDSRAGRLERKMKELGRAVQDGIHSLGEKGGRKSPHREHEGPKGDARETRPEGGRRRDRLAKKVKELGTAVQDGLQSLAQKQGDLGHGHGHENEQGPKPTSQGPNLAPETTGQAAGEKPPPPPPQIVDVIVPPFEGLVRATGLKWREGDLAFPRYGSQSFAPIQKGHDGFTLRCQVEEEVPYLSIFVQSERTNMEETIVKTEVPITQMAASKQTEVMVDVRKWDDEVIGRVIVKVIYAGDNTDNVTGGKGLHLSSVLGGAGVGGSLGLFLGQAKEEIKKRLNKTKKGRKHNHHHGGGGGGGEEEEEEDSDSEDGGSDEGERGRGFKPSADSIGSISKD